MGFLNMVSNLRAEDIACIRCRGVFRSSVDCRMRDCAEADAIKRQNKR